MAGKFRRGSISSEFFRKQVMVYRLDPELADGVSPRVEHRIPMEDYTGVNGRYNRLMRLTPDGKAFAFTASGNDASIYNVGDGHRISQFSPENSANISPDGSLIAAGSFTDEGPVTVWRNGTGEKIMETPVPGKVRKVAITNDNKRLYVGWTSDCLECFDISSGKSLSKVATKLAPVAISPTEDRFVGFLPDSAAKGSQVLGELSTGQTIMVLNEGAHVLNSATYSPDGSCIATIRDRDDPVLLRSMTVEQANARLRETTPAISAESVPVTTPTAP